MHGCEGIIGESAEGRHLGEVIGLMLQENKVAECARVKMDKLWQHRICVKRGVIDRETEAY